MPATPPSSYFRLKISICACGRHETLGVVKTDCKLYSQRCKGIPGWGLKNKVAWMLIMSKGWVVPLITDQQIATISQVIAELPDRFVGDR